MSKQDRNVTKARATELVARLRRARLRERTDLVWPGGALVYGLRVLPSGDVVEAEAAAVRYFSEELKWEPSAMNGEEFGEEVVRQLLARAVFDPATREPLFDAEFMRAELYNDEIAAVWSEYVALREQSDPEDPDLSEGDFQAILAILKKKDATQSRLLAASTLRSFARTMVDRLSNSPPGKSESGSSSSGNTD